MSILKTAALQKVFDLTGRLTAETEGDLPLSYFRVLIAVALLEKTTHEWPSVGDLSRFTGIHKNTLSRVVGALSDRRLGRARAADVHETEGRRPAFHFVERLVDPQDLRLVRVRLTPQGKDRLAFILTPILLT